jgi:apolipoprotein N-acyltransferase
VLTRTPSLPYFLNQAILISPAGHVVWTYEKTYPVIGTDAAFTVSGRGVLPMADTPYGRLTTVICNDVTYPGLLRQAGRNGADILLVPTHESYPFEESANAAQVVYRAIENGTSLIRPSGGDISLMTDYQGRVIASQNYSASNDGILLANGPDRWRINHLQPDRRRVRLPVHARAAAGNPPGPARKAQLRPVQPCSQRPPDQ